MPIGGKRPSDLFADTRRPWRGTGSNPAQTKEEKQNRAKEKKLVQIK
jgi:hypothetical protein